MPVRLTDEQRHDFSAIYDYLRIESDLPSPVDVIVVGGAGPRVDMADRAAELYVNGVAPIVVFSGFAHPDFGINEAELLRDRAVKLGVPSEAISIETRATNTGLNIVLSAEMLSRQGIRVDSVVLVHRPFMARRFLATAEAQWPSPQPRFYVTSANYSFDDYLELDESKGLGNRMLLSILKAYATFKTHPSLGFMSSQPFSPRAEAAYSRLVEAGFVPPRPMDSLSSDKFIGE